MNKKMAKVSLVLILVGAVLAVASPAIALSPMSNVFKAGHRIKLVISSMDHARARNYDLAPESLGRTHAPWHLCSSMTTLHKIHHDLAHPSHLLLPIIPG